MASSVTSFLRTIAGGSRDLEKAEIHSATRVLYTAKGLLLLFVSALSAAIAGNTWWSVFHSIPVGILAASLWFGVSLALNLIVSWKLDQAQYQGGSKVAAFAVAIALGVVVASVNTTFILMRTYDAEIKAFIEGKHQDERAALERQLAQTQGSFVREDNELREKANTAKRRAQADGEALVTPLRAEVSRLQGDYRAAVNAVTVEVDGRGTSRKSGEGQRSRQKRSEASSVEALLTASVSKLNEETARINRQVDEKVAAIDAALIADQNELGSRRKSAEGRLERNLDELDNLPRDGFLQRYTALQAVTWQQPIGALQFLAFFLFLESLMVIVKVFTGRTDYHLLRAAQWATQENESSKAVSAATTERRARELADREAHHSHSEELAKLDVAQLEQLKARGMSDEEFEKAKQKALRKGLKLVASR